MNRFVLLLLVGLLACMVRDASASARAVPPGSVPELGPNEGLLVIGIDTSERISSVRFSREGSYVGGDAIGDVGPGRTMRLFVVSAGDYEWNDINYYGTTMELDYWLGRDPAFHFTVNPGVINYPGELVHRPHWMHSYIHLVNRGLSAIDWVRSQNPGTFERYGFRYAGRYQDPFPDFYRVERAAAKDIPDASLDRTLPVPAEGPMPIPPEELWRPSRVGSVRLSPDGRLLAEEILEDGKRRIDLIDLQSETARRVVYLDAGVESILWAGNSAFAVSLEGGSSGMQTIFLVRLKGDAAKGRTFDVVRLPQPGRIIESLHDDPGKFLFESDAGRGGTMVHRIDVTGLAGLMEFRLAPSFRIDRGVPDAGTWISDNQGRLRAVSAQRDGAWWILYGADGRYEKAFKIDDGIGQIWLSGDGSTFYILTSQERAQRELVAYDPARHATTTLYSKPGVDLDEVVLDGRKNLLGVAYYQGGSRKVDYFAPGDRDALAKVERAFPGDTVRVAARDDSGKRLIVSVERSDRPARLYQLDVDQGVAALLEESAPWLDQRRLAASQVVHATGSDGVAIEGYLTMPAGADGKLPLVVYSHGGPIGVRDTLQYDSVVQFLASLGYAVLQVNFRGSDGYGAQFRQGGKHQYGGLIEDDVDAVTRAVLKDFPVDGDRICAVGASYGGYSALISAIRWPRRFRCVVSISGISDEQLMFTASDTAWTEAGRQALVDAVGDPVADAASMREHAPVFRYRELTIPVMLAHGTEDERVDYEHTRRLIRMLNLTGHPPVVLTLGGAGHGGFSDKDEIALWTGVAGFLRQNLDRKAGSASH